MQYLLSGCCCSINLNNFHCLLSHATNCVMDIVYIAYNYMHKCFIVTQLTWKCKPSGYRFRLIDYSIYALFIYSNCTTASITNACIDTCLTGPLWEIGGVHTKISSVTGRVYQNNTPKCEVAGKTQSVIIKISISRMLFCNEKNSSYTDPLIKQLVWITLLFARQSTYQFCTWFNCWSIVKFNQLQVSSLVPW